MPQFDQNFWQQLWSKTLREQADKIASRPPNAHLNAEVAQLPPGRALDAGCGHGADTLWLAAHGWQVTAVDFSAAALAHGRSMAEAAGASIAERISWLESDLTTWAPEPEHYDLVVCMYVHVHGSVEERVRRMASGVAPGGTLFLVGHRPIDPNTRSRHRRRKPGTSLGRSCSRVARSSSVAAARRRGAPARERRHRCRRRDSRSAPRLSPPSLLRSCRGAGPAPYDTRRHIGALEGPSKAKG